MPAITPQQIEKLHKNTQCVRNICILAHVDHGKTTLSDSLLASNGIISSKLAGKVRYLDSREDEQLRGITMESSAISLFFEVRKIGAEGEVKSSEYLINLIDSPGHVDFSSEVSSASRLCDGALILVDAVEGVCTQTHMVLYQAWKEKIRPVLVLNKIDRLINELQMTSLEAYVHLNKILEQVNAILAGFFTDEIIQKDSRLHEAQKVKESKKGNDEVDDLNEKTLDWNVDEEDDSNIYFSPEKGNVIFSSAIDGWAFRLNSFANLYAKKLGIKESVLQKFLWGEYYFDPKTKRVLLPKHLKGRNLKPMFVQFILDSIWAVYDSVIVKSDAEKVQRIIQTLGVKVLPRDLKSKDSKNLLTAIFTQWLPISSTILLAVIEQVPSPLQSQPDRIPRLWFPDIDSTPSSFTDLEKSVFGCDITEDAPVVAYVSKTFYAPADTLSENRRVQLTAEEMRQLGTRSQLLKNGLRQELVADEMTPLSEVPLDSIPKEQPVSAPNGEVLIGFARVFSGTIKVGQKLYVLGPKYNPMYPDEHCTEATVTSLYLIMGRDLTSLQNVPAGNVVGIAGLGGHVLKSCTLSSTKECHNLGSLRRLAAPILRVALEPWNLSEMPQLIEGLKLLNQSDPCVEVFLQETGEHILATAGELHLERCLTDLKERFAKIEIQVSPPIVPFRETIVAADPSLAGEVIKNPLITLESPNKVFTLAIRMVPLPEKVTNFLTEHSETIRSLILKGNKKDVEITEDLGESSQIAVSGTAMTVDSFLSQLQALFDATNDKQWTGFVDRIWTFGPKRIGPNLLVNNLSYDHPSWRDSVTQGKVSSSPEWLANKGVSIREIEEGLVMGFQLFTSSGPLCNEPVVGTCCFIESFQFTSYIANEDIDSASESVTNYGLMAGQLISTMKEALKASFLTHSPRLMMAMYSSDIQATADVLGRVYAVINQRRGKILSEEMKEGTSFFHINSKLPVIESFNFADEIRKRTSGAAIPQLIFTGFEILDLDPYWVPTTEEELEDLGELADRENVAKRYMEQVRKRKGLFVETKVVASAEKQRTLKK